MHSVPIKTDFVDIFVQSLDFITHEPSQLIEIFVYVWLFKVQISLILQQNKQHMTFHNITYDTININFELE